MYAVIGDIWRDYGGYRKTDGVSQQGVGVRREIVWLPKTDTDPNTRMENFGRVTFSVVLTKSKISEM